MLAIGSWLPNQCPLCLEVHSGDSWLCIPCLNTLPRLGPACPRCAEPLPESRLCGACLDNPPPQQRTLAALRYAPPVDQLIQALKFHDRLGLARDLGRLLAEAAAGAPEERPDAVLPVPLHRGRLRERGFNQALEIARVVGRHLDIPLCRGVRRIRATRVQSTLDARSRRSNLRAAFQARPGLPTHLAVIDDVMTTGSTTAALAQTLLAAGVSRVEVWVVARAGR